VLVFGPDIGLVRERVDALVRASVDDPNDPFALARIEGDELAGNPSRLVEEAHTVPLFGGRRAVHAKAGKTPGQGFAELLVPRGRDLRGIEITRVVIPVAVSMDLDAAVVEVALEARDGPPQRLHGLVRREGLGQDPQAHFP